MFFKSGSSAPTHVVPSPHPNSPIFFKKAFSRLRQPALVSVAGIKQMTHTYLYPVADCAIVLKYRPGCP